MRHGLIRQLLTLIFVLIPFAEGAHASLLGQLKAHLIRPKKTASTPLAPKCAEIFSELANPAADQISVFPYKSKRSEVKPGQDYFLGEGHSAHVYLKTVGPAHARVVIKKVYKPNAFGTQRFESDVAGLRALYAGQSATSEDSASAPFEVALGERYFEPPVTRDDLPQAAVRLQFIEGRTVHALLLDEALAPETKETIRENYALKMEELKTRLERSGDLKSPIQIIESQPKYFFDAQVDGLILIKTESKSGGPLLIKSDNIVVDPFDLNTMTIVDPY